MADHQAGGQPPAFSTRFVEAGCFASIRADRTGRRTSSPPQFGQMPSLASAQSAQNVHSKVQMRASSESGGSVRSQHSQLGRSSSTQPYSAATAAEAADDSAKPS